MSALQLVFVGTVTLLLVHKLVIRPLFSPLRHLPAPDQGPVRTRFFVEPGPDQLRTWAHEIPNDGFIRYYGLLNVEKVLVTDPNGAHDILAAQPYSYVKPSRITTIIRSLLGDGIVVVEGHAHKVQKKAMQPAFKHRQIKDLYPVFRRKTDELIDVLTKAINEKSSDDETSLIDLGTYLHQATLDIIGIAGFGLDFNCLKDSENQLAWDYARGFNPSKAARKYRLLALALPSWLLDRLPIKRNQDLRAAVAAIRECTGKLIEERGARLDSEKPGASEEAPENGSKDIIGMLMADHGVRDKETLINQSMTILGAGHDTVHFAINCAIWEMCKHPGMQERLRKEIRQNSKDPATASGDVSTDAGSIDNLPYLQAVCDEVLRLHNSVPTLYRVNTEPTTVNGEVFPKGITFIMPIGAYNLAPQLWKSDPLRFDPERWLKDSSLGGAYDRKAYLTFSTGARVCIGERLARAELKHLLAGLVCQFNFTWAGTGENGQSQELVIEHGIANKMIGGMKVRMEQLDGR